MIFKVFMSNETITDIKLSVSDAIKTYADKYGYEEALIRAFIKHESNGYYLAYRVDYNVLRNQSWYKKTLTDAERKQKKYYASYGLMQILYGNAKHYGFKGNAEGLFGAEANIKYGCKVLNVFKRKYKGRLLDMVSAYNQGSNRRNDKGKYRNQKYVDSVYKYYKKFGGVK